MIPLIAPRILPGWVWAAVTVGLMAWAGLAGYRYAAARGEAALAQCRAASAESQRRAAEEAAARLSAAENAARKAQAELSRREAAFQVKLKEVRSEIYSFSSGRECLSGPLRLRLNAAIAADSVPARAPGADPAAAAPATDPIHPSPHGIGATTPPSPSGRGAVGEGGSTDADIAAWILDAASLYEQCRARIDAIRAWDEVTHGR